MPESCNIVAAYPNGNQAMDTDDMYVYVYNKVKVNVEFVLTLKMGNDVSVVSAQLFRSSSH